MDTRHLVLTAPQGQARVVPQPLDLLQHLPPSFMAGVLADAGQPTVTLSAGGANAIHRVTTWKMSQ